MRTSDVLEYSGYCLLCLEGVQYQELKDCVAATMESDCMDESGGKCTTITVPDKIVMDLKNLNVQVIGEERPLSFPNIRYGDESWNILKKWAAQSSCEHSVVLAHHPSSAEHSVRNVLGNGNSIILAQYRNELRSLCEECSRASRNDVEPESQDAGLHGSKLGPGEHFYHGKYSWDTLPAKLQSSHAQYPLLSRMPPNAYLCDIMYHYPDCIFIVLVYKNSGFLQ